MVILVQEEFKAVSMQIQPIEDFKLFTAWSTVPMLILWSTLLANNTRLG